MRNLEELVAVVYLHQFQTHFKVVYVIIPDVPWVAFHQFQEKICSATIILRLDVYLRKHWLRSDETITIVNILTVR